MATEVERMNPVQALADATCLIYDRSTMPEKVIGQAWLVSKSRVVCLASCVSNYVDAPWALIAKFPHPDLTYAVKNISLHPDFNKREARDAYLSQVNQQPRQPFFENDIATLTLDPEIQPTSPEKIQELNRALSLPFPINPQDLSGVMRAGEAPNIMQTAIMTGRSGLLTFLDSRSVPFARIQIKAGRLGRAMYNQLTNELAVCEMIWRKPSGNYVFSTNDNFLWPDNLAEINIPTEQLGAEANRRAGELPRIIEGLGGPDVRFRRAAPTVDFASINPQQRWVAERLWQALDGFMPVNKLSERVNADTYTILKTLWDMRSMGLISVNHEGTFHMSGQLGPVLAPSQEVDVAFWDQVTAFYLDPVSGGPISTPGYFVGAGKMISPKTLMHTINVPSTTGAAILKDGKMIGIHTGAYMARAGQTPFPVFQMQALTALNDLGVKRLRATADEIQSVPAEDPQSTSMRMQTRRLAESIESAKEAASALPTVDDSPPFLQPFSKLQIAYGGAGVAMFLLITTILGWMRPTTAPPDATPIPITKTATQTQTTPAVQDVARAITIATGFAGFKEDPVDTYKYGDSSALTPGKDSFSLISERQNQNITYAVWPTDEPMKKLKSLWKNLPFYGYAGVHPIKIDEGATDKIVWFTGKYGDGSDVIVATMGAFTCPSDPTKCILFVAVPHDRKLGFDHKLSTMVTERMFNEGGPSAQTEQKEESTLATPMQLEEYRKSIQTLIKNRYKEPKVTAEENVDTVSAMEVTIDGQGQLTKKAFTHSAQNEAWNNALQKVIDASVPFPAAPKTEKGEYSVVITVDGGKVTVDEP